MQLVVMIILTALGLTESYQITSQQNMVHDRGQTPALDAKQALTGFRAGPKARLRDRPLVFSGLLVDASCVERTPLDLRQPPESMAAKRPAQPPENEGAAPGLAVDTSIRAAEHADVDPHLVPDLVSRQRDPSCAISASTSSFALLTNENRLLNLDEGGNTLAAEALLSYPPARAMFNGAGPAVKPWTATQGFVSGDRLTVDRILELGAAPPAH